MIANAGNGYWDHNMFITPSSRNPNIDSFISNLSAKMKRGGMISPSDAHFLIQNGYTEFGGVKLNSVVAPKASVSLNSALAPKASVRYGM